MSTAPAPITPDQVGRTSQIIVGALMMGQIMFAGVALTMSRGKHAELGPMVLIAAVATALMILVSLIISQLTAANAIRQLAAQRPGDWRAALASVYSTKTIIANAPLEGAGLLNCLAYLIHVHWLSLACLGIGLALMSITFPSQTKFESWAEQVQREHS